MPHREVPREEAPGTLHVLGVPVPHGVGALGIFLLALGVRLAPWRRVFREGGILPPHGADEYYHLRRIWYGFCRFPEILERDPYVGFPVGSEVPMAPGFDWAIAGLARLLGADDQAGVEAIAAWVPAVLGAATAVVAAAIAARVFSATAGAIAGVLLALLPGHFHASQVGYVDHHVAVALGAALLVALALLVVRRPAGERWILPALLLGLGTAGFLLTWPGSLLHVAVLQGLAGVWMIQARTPAIASSRAWHLALGQGVAAAALAPYALGRSWSEFGGFTPLLLSSFQPLWFAAAALACALLAGLWSRTAAGRGPQQRWLSAAGVGLGALALALVGIPGLPASLGAAAGWFVREDDDFLSNVLEIQSLFGGGLGLPPQSHLTWLVYLTPLALGWLGVRAARSGRADLWLLAGWALALFALVVSQVRFLTSFTVPFAIVWGGALAALAERARRAMAMQRRGVRAGALIGAALALALAVEPSARFLFPQLTLAWEGPGGAPPTRRLVRVGAYHQAARWLRENSPPTSGYLDATRRPEYGVLTSWDMGHLVRYVAERPLVQDNFGVYAGREQFLAGGRYFRAPSEAEALRIVEPLGVRYVLVDENGSSLRRREGPGSMTARLFRPRGGLDAKEGRVEMVLPPLERHRLINETSLVRAWIPHVMIYEIVPGARITGRAAPGAVVRLALAVRSQQRVADFAYRARTRADDRGRYGFLVPYATGAKGPVATGEAYSVECGDAEGSVRVSEADVAEGATLPGPALDCGGAAS